MCRGPACLTFILLAFSALGVPRERALAEPPRGTTPETRSNPADGTLPREPPRLELSLLFENDNKFLGLWGVFAEDGHDVGRTHGMFFSIVRPLRSGVRLEIELGSELFSAQLYDEDGGRLNLGRDGLPNPDSYEDRNLYFNELSWLVARARGVLPREPRLAWVLGGGLVISNRSRMSPGATFFQEWFHDLIEVFYDEMREYRYLDSGDVRGGALLELGLRALGRVGTRSRFRLRGFGEASFAGNTLPHGTFFRAQGRAAIDVGRRNRFDLPILEVAVGQEIRTYPESGDVSLDSQVDLYLHAPRLDVIIIFDGYYGSPHNRYYSYNFNNTTTTLGLGFRVP